MGLLKSISESSALPNQPWNSQLVIIVYAVSQVIYNLYFHPLSGFPGSKLAAISHIFYARAVVGAGGSEEHVVKALHEKHDVLSDVVRWSPNELSFSSAAAWQDIYGTQRSGDIFVKDHNLKAPNIVFEKDPAKHLQAKKMLSHAFSPKALREQEDVILKYADMLMVAILEQSRKGPINLIDFYEWFTFDVLGELCFSEPFGSVEARKSDEWVATVLKMVKFVACDSAIYHLSPLVEAAIPYFMPAEFSKGMLSHVTQSKAKIIKRRDRGEKDRKDFCSYLFEIQKEMKQSDWELTANSQALIIAGSETVATTLSAMTHWLCKIPRAYLKLKEEVRSRFNSASEITSQSATFPYLTAVIHETLRIVPPVSHATPRTTPKGGKTVGGVFVPRGTSVSVAPFATTHNPKNFKDPDIFRPERWMDPKCTDKLNASNPFSLGPRACMGQNMAWIELRILAAKMIFLFDFEAIDKEIDWGRDVKSLGLWLKPALMTVVTPRNIPSQQMSI
ncbi:cytochrome P450-6 [Coleophoma crateriformis]|uniref:Cytochrome P450-6 n=1 Tax=Coleophoma crateriformis TaxID=565419 RepID=A0A3D8SI71_9HELO|nr:cytochrome P450-6 [Coleophoma crateriformis]